MVRKEEGKEETNSNETPQTLQGSTKLNNKNQNKTKQKQNQKIRQNKPKTTKQNKKVNLREQLFLHRVEWKQQV